MKAICLVPGKKGIHIRDVPEPQIEQPFDVKVRVLQVGICGTDREEVAGGRADAPKKEKELIIGHEMVGEVVEAGSRASLKKGDLVVLMVRRPCSSCEYCKAGCSDMCSSGQYTERGIKERHGFDTEFVVDNEQYMIRVPPEIRGVAVLTEPTTVVEKAIDHASRLQAARLPAQKSAVSWLEGKKALVAGLGPIGLLAAMILRLRGARVFGLDRADPSSKRVQILQGFGGEYFQGKPENFEADIVVEAAGVAALDFELIDHLAINGIYVSTGVPAGDALLSVHASKLLRSLVLKNQVVFGSVNAGKKHFEMAVEDLQQAHAKWPHLLSSIITHKVSFLESATSLQTKDPEEIKAVIEWSA